MDSTFNKTYIYFSFYIILITSINLSAQRTLYKNYNHIWSNNVGGFEKVNSKFLDNDVVYLEKETEYEISRRTKPVSGNIGGFRNRGTTIKNRIVAKILTEKGKVEFTNFLLPESINKYTYDYEGMASRQISFNDLKHYDLEVQYFAARKLKENGKFDRLDINDEIIIEKLGKLGEAHRSIEYLFKIENVEVGEVIEVVYEIFVEQPLGYPIDPSFNEEMTGFYEAPSFYYWWRLFFNDKYPIQKSITTFSFFNELHIEWQYFNNAQPDTIINTNTFNKHIWYHNNLEASNFELNEHAHKNLPNVYLYYHNLLYGPITEGGSVDYQPYTWEFLCRSVMQFKGENDVLSSQFSLKERLLNKFFDKHKTENIKPIQHLKAMHNGIINDFTYKDNKKYYFGRSIALYDTGRNLKNLNIYELNRFDVYDGLLRRLKQNYYMVFVPDKRLDAIDEERPIVPVNPLIFYAVQFGQSLVYLMPKNNSTGYYIDELPFFLEGQKALLINQSAVSKFDEHNIVFVDLPASTEKDNYRIIRGKAKVNLEQKKLEVEAQLKLSGQYSTLLRNFYNNIEEPQLANKNYYQHFYKWAKPNKIIENKKLNVEDTYPFKAEKTVKFDIENNITLKNDSIYTINITKCLQHVFDKKLAKAKERNYYFDFKKQDNFTYLFEFDEEVVLQEDENSTINFYQEADFGKYYTKIEQLSPTKILLESKLEIKEAFAEKAELSALRAIYRHIKLLNENLDFSVKLLKNNN